MFVRNTIKLSTVEHEELTQRANRQSGRADESPACAADPAAGCRSHVGFDWHEAGLHRQLYRSAGASGLVAERLAGLFSRHAGQLPTKLTPALEARILEWSVKRQPT